MSLSLQAHGVGAKATDASPAVVIGHLSCTFRSAEALHDVCLTIPEGSVFGLVGLNGAGKTTLIRHLIGRLKPQRGSVRVLGEDPVATPESVLQRVGYVAEEDALPRWMTVGQLLDFMKSMYRGWDEAYARELLQLFSLSRPQRLADLSKGGRARAGLLVALAYRPELLILDEPSYGLDPIARQDILEAIVRTASDQGRTVLFSSHLLEEVARVCDAVAVIHEGRVVETIALESLADRYAEAVCELHSPNPPLVAGLFGWQNRGREWSVVVDRSVHPDELSMRVKLDSASLLEWRPVGLQRWFQGRVAGNAAAPAVTQEIAT